MGERRRTSGGPPAIGGVSLLVSFAVLCLTVFALLSLTTVRADGRLGEASARAVTDYYAADGEAQAILARLRSGESPEEVTFYDGIPLRADYAVPLSETQELRVSVLLEEGGEYEILRWQVVSTEEWEFDDNLNVWDGELFS